MKIISHETLKIMMINFAKIREAYISAKIDYLDKIRITKIYCKAESLSCADKVEVKKAHKYQSLDGSNFDKYYNQNLIPLTKTKIKVLRKLAMDKCIQAKRTLKEKEKEYLDVLNQIKLDFGFNMKLSG